MQNSVRRREETAVTMVNNPKILRFTISGQLPRTSVSSGWQRVLAEDLLPVLMSNSAQVKMSELKKMLVIAVSFFN